MKTPRFTGPFKWSALRNQLLSLREDIQSARKVAGRHVRISEYPGKGTVIDVDTTARRPGPAVPTGACCACDDTCSETTEAECNSLGRVYQGDGTTCSPNPCGECPRPVSPTHIVISAYYQVQFHGNPDIVVDLEGDLTWTEDETGCYGHISQEFQLTFDCSGTPETHDFLLYVRVDQGPGCDQYSVSVIINVLDPPPEMICGTFHFDFACSTIDSDLDHLTVFDTFDHSGGASCPGSDPLHNGNWIITVS